jgi:hypothetical protein
MAIKEYFRIHPSHPATVHAVLLAKNLLLSMLLSSPPAPYSNLYAHARLIQKWERRDEWMGHIVRENWGPAPRRSRDEEFADGELFGEVLWGVLGGEEWEVVRGRAERVAEWLEGCYEGLY